MGNLIFLPMLVGIIYLMVILGILYLIYTWVNKFILLKQERNDLLREIIKKMKNQRQILTIKRS